MQEKLKYYVYKIENGLGAVSEREKDGLEDDLIGIASTEEEAKKILLEYISKPTRKYRLGYDYVFLPKKSFEYKGDKIGSMSIIVLFKIFDIEGNEILFETKEEKLKEKPLKLVNGEKYYLCDLFKCCFNKELFRKSKTFNFIPTKKIIIDNYIVVMDINFYTKDIDKDISEPVQIEEKEFNDIMLKNLDLFNVSDNKPAQSTSYITEEV